MKTSENGKTVYMEIAVWWDADDDCIHVVPQGSSDFYARVTQEGENAHPDLFKDLSAVLKKAGAPAP